MNILNKSAIKPEKKNIQASVIIDKENLSKNPIYYVYGHYTLDTNELFYIGKGNGNRAWISSPFGRSDKWHEKVNKHGGRIVKLFNQNLTEHEAYELEVQLIQDAKENGIYLVNLDRGGKGGIDAGWSNPTFREKHKQGMLRYIAKKWDGLIGPDGTEYREIRSLNRFAREHNIARISKDVNGNVIYLAPAELYKVAKGTKENYKGWRSINPYIPNQTTKVNTPLPCAFISPDGTVYQAESLSKFAKQHGLNVGSLYKLHKGKLLSSKGWMKAYPVNMLY